MADSSIDRIVIHLITNKNKRDYALKILREELSKARRPWGSIEPFIIALYHLVFIKNDLEAGKILYEYLLRVLPKICNIFPRDVQEVGNLIIKAVDAKIKNISNATNILRNITPSSPLGYLVKEILLMDFEGKYNWLLDKYVEEINNSMRCGEIMHVSEDPEYSEIVSNFLIDLDIYRINSREVSIYNNIYSYFLARAKELRTEYKIYEKLIKRLEEERKKLEEEYNKLIKQGIRYIRWTMIVIDVFLFVVSIVLALQGVLQSTLISGISSFLISIVLILEKIRKIDSKFFYWIARKIVYIKGKKILKEMKRKEYVMNEIRRLIFR